MPRTVQIQLPEKVADELKRAIAEGWFRSEEELVLTAVRDYLGRRQHEWMEEFHREDIAWALSQKGKAAGNC